MSWIHTFDLNVLDGEIVGDENCAILGSWVSALL